MSGLAVAFRARLGAFALDAAFEAPLSGVTALFGPSGSGKTSILRAVAGLEKFSGRCALGAEIWQDEKSFVPAHRRAIGYVFQEASLFPHLNVRQNLEFGWRRAGPERPIGFDLVVGLLGLEALLGRAPTKLSGGERQRVSLGRALLSQPRLLLLDEPMSALDGAAKRELLSFFEAMHRALDLPMVLVSHDVGEVERLADTMVAVAGGRVVAEGPLEAMLLSDRLALKHERDAAAVLAARVVGYDGADGLSELELGTERLLVAGRAGAPGETVRVRVMARDVSLAVARPSATTILNCLEVRILAIEVAPQEDATVTLALGEAKLLARVTRRSLRVLGLTPGQAVFAQVKGVSLLAGPK